LIRNSSYTFDITTIGDPDSGMTAHGMILLSVGLRMDIPNDGGMSSIIDFNTGEGLVLFHGNKLAITDLPDSEKGVMFSGPFSILLNPIETLWNLNDGTEIPLGKNEIDGQSAIGFKVKQTNENYNSEIIVWANSQTGTPIKLEINLYVPEIQHAVTIIMNKFDLNAQLDEELFVIKPPSGYKVTTFQKLRENPASAYRGE
jgi:outer membrane lipoprotein-sorting protein